MDRRLGGALLLVLALLAALVVPGAAGRRTSGLATRVPVPQPPEVGLCLVPGPHTQAEGNAWGLRFGEFEPCDAESYGEVVGTTSMQLSELPSLEDSISTDDPALQSVEAMHRSCQAQVGQYAGLEQHNAGWTIPGVPQGEVAWLPAVNLRSMVVGPSLSAQRVGAEWTVCVAEVYLEITHRGSVRDAFSSNVLPSRFGICRTGPGPNAASVPCSIEYRTQILGWADLIGRSTEVSDTTLDRTCHAFAEVLLGTADPTFGGELELSAVNLNDSGYGQNAECQLSAPEGRELNRSLIGVGDGPLPWVS